MEAFNLPKTRCKGTAKLQETTRNKEEEETSLMLAASPGQGRGPTDPPWPPPFSSPKPIRSACRLFLAIPPIRLPFPSDHEQQQLFQPRLVAGNHQVEAGIACGLKEWDDSTTTESAAPELIPDERVMNALHKMQDDRQQTKVISRRRSPKMYTEQATLRTNGNSAYEAMETTTGARDRQEEARIFYERKMSRDRRSRDDLQRHHQRHSCKKRSARETRQDRDNEGGALGDDGSRLLQDAPRSPRRSAETLERARSAGEPAKHGHPIHAMKTAKRAASRERIQTFGCRPDARKRNSLLSLLQM